MRTARFFHLAFLILGFASPWLFAKAIPISEPVTFDKIATFLEKYPSVTTIHRLLGFLPKSFLSHYTLMHSSESSQGASPEFPRAIVYGSDGTLLLAFNGRRDQAGHFNLEMIQWRPEQKRFELRVIEFPRWNASVRKVRISAPDPQQCLGCHRHDPRPNWEPYAEWPGAYAGSDDILDNDEPSLQTKLAEFVARAEKLPRYSRLVGLKEGYFPKAPVSPSFLSRTRTPVQHNIRLSLYTNHLNYQRLARLMTSTPDFAQHRYQAMGFLAGCEVGRATPYDERSEAILKLFEARGVDVSDWSTSFEKRTYLLNSPNSWAPDLLGQVLLMKEHRDLAPLFWEYEGYYGLPAAQALRDDEEKTCSELRKRRNATKNAISAEKTSLPRVPKY